MNIQELTLIFMARKMDFVSTSLAEGSDCQRHRIDWAERDQTIVLYSS